MFTAERMRGCEVDSSFSASDQMHGSVNEHSILLVLLQLLLTSNFYSLLDLMLKPTEWLEFL